METSYTRFPSKTGLVGISHRFMRRTVAFALTAVLALFVLLPYLSLVAGATGNSTTCCRRKDPHCACCQHNTRASSDTAHKFAVATAVCPCHNTFLTANRTALYPVSRFVLSASLTTSQCFFHALDFRFAPADGIHFKRGPPSLLI